MKNSPKIQNLLVPYGKSLRLYLKSQSPARLRSAHTLGQQAVDSGVQVLDLAWVHRQAMHDQGALAAGPAEERAESRHSRAFFSACNHVLEANSSAAVSARRSLDALKKTTLLYRKECGSTLRQLEKVRVLNGKLSDKLKASIEQESDEARKLRTLQAQMSQLSRGVIAAQEEERKRISRELHDVIAQLLTAINLRLSKMDVDVAKGNRSARKSIQRTQRLVEKSVAVVHRFARELRPAVLDDLGLIPALRSLLDDVAEESGIRVSMTIFAGIESMKIEKRTVLYRVAQEALVNIRKHSNATHVDLSVRQLAGRVRMVLKDDGVGFDVGKAFAGKSPKQLGLLGMRERVEMVGGTFVVTSAPNEGCSLQADIPFATRAKKAVSP